MPDLTLVEVKARLKSYSDSAVTDELYSSGESLVANAVDRMTRLDSKGLALAAYSGGILTILVSTYSHEMEDAGCILAISEATP
jgi:hypothetical protein